MSFDNITRRWKITGSRNKGKPWYHLEEYHSKTKKWQIIGDAHVNSTLKQLKLYLMELYPKYRIYTQYKSNGREFWGFIPENPENAGFTPYPESNFKLNASRKSDIERKKQ